MCKMIVGRKEEYGIQHANLAWETGWVKLQQPRWDSERRRGALERSW